MSYLLDTNACIQYLNGTSAGLRRKLESSRPEDIFLCAVVRAELFYGAIKSVNAQKNLRKLKHFLDRFTSLPFRLTIKAPRFTEKFALSLRNTATSSGLTI